MMSPSTQIPSYRHRGGDVPLLGETIDRCFRRIAEALPRNEAVVSVSQQRRLSYADLHRQVDDVARGLLALGLGRGSRVGILSTDNVEWIVLQLATARVGAVLVNINPAYRTTELEYALRRSRLQVLFLIPSFRSSDYVGMMRSLLPALDDHRPSETAAGALADLREVVVFDPANPLATARPAAGFLTWQDVVERGAGVPDERMLEAAAELDPDDPINIQFTSGTTGFPKAVVLTHHNILNNGHFTGRAIGLGPDDRLCVPVPFYHCFGMVVSNLACLSLGAAIVIPAPHFDPAATLQCVAHERCTALHGVPTMFVAMLEEPGLDAMDLSALRTGIIAGAPCPPELVRRIIEDLGCEDIRIGYGQTEASPVTHCTEADDSFERRVGTVGTNLPHQEVKIVDPGTGATVAIGVQGEVCFRGYHVMRGYFEQDEATRDAIDEAGWLRSGDLGVMDADGYLAITGRLKDLIIRGGENIYPAEIEATCCDHPDIAEIAVFGVPDERMGEEVGCWVRLHDGATTTPDALRDWASDRMAHYKVPRHVWFVRDFPMTISGKIQKFRIREVVERWLEGDAQSISPWVVASAAPRVR